jgi:copper chaperone
MKQTFIVTGMTCGHCERAVMQAVKRTDPLAMIHIDRSQNVVEIDSQIGRQQLASVITEEGYEVAN